MLCGVLAHKHRGGIAAGLVFAVFLWGGNNTGVKYLVGYWPPVWVGGSRFLCAGLLMMALLRWTRWLGPHTPPTAEQRARLWWRGGLSLALYIIAFNWANRLTQASHVALYLGAAPVWALLLEGRRGMSVSSLVTRYLAAALALSGVVTLFAPTLVSRGGGSIAGELLGLSCSMLWTLYGRQCRVLGVNMTGAEMSAHTMWRAGVLLMPVALMEAFSRGLPWKPELLAVQSYCILAGGVVAFALWNNALRHWKTSEVYLFNNLIPLSTTLWAHFVLGEEVTPTFWMAMVLIISGVVIGQANWQKILGKRWMPEE